MNGDKRDTKAENKPAPTSTHKKRNSKKILIVNVKELDGDNGKGESVFFVFLFLFHDMSCNIIQQLVKKQIGEMNSGHENLSRPIAIIKTVW